MATNTNNYKEYTVRVYKNRTEWYLNEKYHRENGPAIEYADGSKLWWLNNNRHREDGPAIECANGTKEWYLNGKRHRKDGPAIEYADGYKAWWVNGKCHRVDGPAVEYANGTKEWWLNGIQYSEADWKKEIAKLNISCNGKIVEIDGKKYKLIEEKQ